MSREMPDLDPLGGLQSQGRPSEENLSIRVGEGQGKVILMFGHEITSVGFSPEQARQIAAALIKQADAIK